MVGHKMNDEEWASMERKYQNATKQISVILEGVAVGFILDKKKRAGQIGSRGKYISHCIRFYEENISLMKEKNDEIESLWKTIRRLTDKN